MKKRLLSILIACMLIFTTCIPMSVSADTVTDEAVATAIANFKAEWEALRLTKTELLAIPGGANRLSTADSDLTDAEKEAFGEYYYHVSDGYQEIGYTIPAGKDDWTDYSSKENVKYFGYFRKLEGSARTNFNIVFTDGTKWSGLWAGNADNAVHYFEQSASNVNGVDMRALKGISIKNGDSSSFSKINLGCLYVSYDEALALPENCESFTAADWINAVEAIDFTGLTVSDSFKSAYIALQSVTDGYMELAAAKDAVDTVIKNVTEVFAIPSGGVSTADLSAEEQAAYGDTYKHVTSGDLMFTYPAENGGFKSYPASANVKYSFSYRIISTTNEYKICLQASTGGDKYISGSQNALSKYSIAGANWFGTNAISYLKIGNWWGATFDAGNIFASYDAPLSLGENYELYSMDEFKEAVEAADFTDYTVSDEFSAAYTALQSVMPGYAEIVALKNSLSGVKKTVTELFAIPADNDYRWESSDEQKEYFGDYYAWDPAEGKTLSYVGANGSFKDYTGKENVKFSFSAVTNSTVANMNVKFYDVNYGVTKSQWPCFTGNPGTVTKWNFGASSLLPENNYKVTAIQVINSNSMDLMVGSIYASYDEPLALPAGSDTWSAAEWIDYIADVDLTGYVVTPEFKAAYTALQAATDGYKEIAAVKNAFAALSGTATELFAVPVGAVSTADLTAEEKAAYGDSYAAVTGGEIQFNDPNGGRSFKDYSDKENVKVFFSYKFKTKNSEAKFCLQFNYTNDKYISNSLNVLGKYENTYATLMNGAASLSGIKIGNWWGATFDVGSIFVSYDVPVTLPEGSDFFTAEEWLNTINTTDLSDDNLTAEFNSAAANLKTRVSTIRSDIDGDGLCGALDLKALAQHILGVASVAQADINCDGVVNVADVVRIKKVIANFI